MLVEMVGGIIQINKVIVQYSDLLLEKMVVQNYGKRQRLLVILV